MLDALFGPGLWFLALSVVVVTPLYLFVVAFVTREAGHALRGLLLFVLGAVLLFLLVRKNRGECARLRGEGEDQAASCLKHHSLMLVICSEHRRDCFLKVRIF